MHRFNSPEWVVKIAGCNVPPKRTDPDLRFANNMKHSRARIYSEACNGFVTVAEDSAHRSRPKRAIGPFLRYGL